MERILGSPKKEKDVEREPSQYAVAYLGISVSCKVSTLFQPCLPNRRWHGDRISSGWKVGYQGCLCAPFWAESYAMIQPRNPYAVTLNVCRNPQCPGCRRKLVSIRTHRKATPFLNLSYRFPGENRLYCGWNKNFTTLGKTMQVKCFPYTWIWIVTGKFYCNGAHDLRNQVFIRRLVCFYSHIKSVEHRSLWRLCFSNLPCLWNQFMISTQLRPRYAIRGKKWAFSSLPPFLPFPSALFPTP